MPFEMFSTADEAAELERIVARAADLHEQLNALQAQQAEVLADAMHLALRQIARMASASARDHEMPVRAISADIATATRTADRTVQAGMNHAAEIVDRFPATHAAWRGGRISRGHVEAIVRAGAPIDGPSERSAFEAAVLPRAESLTAGRLAPIATRLAEEFHVVPLSTRHAAASAERHVRLLELDDGMGELRLVAPYPALSGIVDRATRIARAVVADARQAGPDDDAVHDERTLEQVRVDVLLDLALAGETTVHRPTGIAAIHATVEVTVPALTLLGADERGATLTGRSPIDPATARRLAGRTHQWTRVLTDPVSGGVLAVDGYRPNEHLRRFLRARDEHCRFPGCRMPTRRSDIDHTHDAALGGETSHRNMAHLCRRHHSLKHHSTWTLRQLPGGVLQWTSPTGRMHVDRPPAVVRFVPDRDTANPPAPPPPF